MSRKALLKNIKVIFLKTVIIIIFAVQVHDAWGSHNFCS